MNPAQRKRLAALMDPWCNVSLVQDLIGLDVTDPKLRSSFVSWCQRYRGKADVLRPAATHGTQVNRHELEQFLTQQGLTSWKWAAVHLGMSEEDLRRVHDLLLGKGVPLQIELDRRVSDQLVRQRDAALLHRAFPSIRFHVFSDHSDMCRALHAAIQEDLDISIEPLRCVTSLRLDPDEPDIAEAFDAITMDPVGVRYQVWLDTKKPLSLRPDVCSMLFYAKNVDALGEHVMSGSEPTGPLLDRLRAA